MAPVILSAPPRPFRSASLRARAFSLVEVVLAVGVVAFAFVAIMGLLPAGMTQFRQAIDTSVCAQIAQRVIMEAQQTDFDILTDSANIVSPTAGQTFQAPTKANGALRYFDEQGNEIPATGSTAPTNTIYQVNTRIMLMPTLPGSDTPSSSMTTVTVQVAFNPSTRVIPLYAASGTDPNRNLFNTTGLNGMPVKTYNAQVGRNK